MAVEAEPGNAQYEQSRQRSALGCVVGSLAGNYALRNASSKLVPSLHHCFDWLYPIIPATVAPAAGMIPITTPKSEHSTACRGVSAPL